MRVILALFILFSVYACSRSEQFERDQHYSEIDRRPSQQTRPEEIISRETGQSYELKKRVYVLGFTNETELGGEDISRFATSEYDRQFRFSKKSFIPEDIVLEEKPETFFDNGKLKLNPLVTLARKHGLSAVLIGRIVKTSFKSRGDDIGILRKNRSMALATVELNLIDIQSGRVIFNETRTADSSSNTYRILSQTPDENEEWRIELIEDAIRSVVEKSIIAIRRSMDKITWEGKIAKVSNNYIYINAGRASGLNSGDILKVLTEGQDLFDKETGAYIGKTEGQMKGTLEVKSFIGQDGASCVIHSGGNFDEDDVVKLY